MQAIRNKNTRPELIVRKLLFARGFRFRLHVRSLPGTPDIVLPKYRAAIFVHGCFWHGHNCFRFKLPQVRREFWQSKIDSNRLRYERDLEALRLAGWRVMTVWECSLTGRLKWDAVALVDHLTHWIVHGESMANVVDVRHR